MAIWRQKQGGEGTKLKIKLFSRSIKTSNVISCVGVWGERNSFKKWHREVEWKFEHSPNNRIGIGKICAAHGKKNPGLGMC